MLYEGSTSQALKRETQDNRMPILDLATCRVGLVHEKIHTAQLSSWLPHHQ